jgi:hypothetical protein
LPSQHVLLCGAKRSSFGEEVAQEAESAVMRVTTLGHLGSMFKRGDRIDICGKKYVVIDGDDLGAILVRRTLWQWVRDFLISLWRSFS